VDSKDKLGTAAKPSSGSTNKSDNKSAAQDLWVGLSAHGGGEIHFDANHVVTKTLQSIISALNQQRSSSVLALELPMHGQSPSSLELDSLIYDSKEDRSQYLEQGMSVPIACELIEKALLPLIKNRKVFVIGYDQSQSCLKFQEILVLIIIYFCLLLENNPQI